MTKLVVRGMDCSIVDAEEHGAEHYTLMSEGARVRTDEVLRSVAEHMKMKANMRFSNEYTIDFPDGTLVWNTKE